MNTYAQRIAKLVGTTVVATASATGAMATEGGGGIYPNGAENYMVGAVPPPGTYFLMYGSQYEATSLRDNAGKKVPIDFNVKATALAPRLVWVPQGEVLGGNLVFHAIAPLVDLKVKAAGSSGASSGLGDLTLGAGLAYHASPNLHYVFAVDVNAPTGKYSKGDLANIGRNYWNVEPLFAVTYVQPSGLNADLKVMYDLNARNKDTDYKSGQELHADYAVGWGLGNSWTVGVGGYAYLQTTADKKSGASVEGNKGRAMAIGPSIKYDGGKWLVTVKYEKEFGVRNRAQGGGLKVKAVLPF